MVFMEEKRFCLEDPIASVHTSNIEVIALSHHIDLSVKLVVEVS